MEFKECTRAFALGTASLTFMNCSWTAGATPVHWLIRAAQDRLIVRPEKRVSPDESSPISGESAAARQIRAAALASAMLFQKEISVRGRDQKIRCKTGSRDQPRESRQAQVEVRATTLQLRPPSRAS